MFSKKVGQENQMLADFLLNGIGGEFLKFFSLYIFFCVFSVFLTSIIAFITKNKSRKVYE